jgi:flagellar secretion chaperone FliS
MYPGMYQEYLDAEVLTADPVKLIELMYRGALESITGARAALAAGDIPGRARLISKTVAIVNELALSLDHSRGQELCRSLVELYDYMARRLNEANARQADEPLAEVAKLLGDLLGAWQQVGAVPQEQQPQTETYKPAAYAAEAGAEYQRVSYAW